MEEKIGEGEKRKTGTTGWVNLVEKVVEVAAEVCGLKGEKRGKFLDGGKGGGSVGNKDANRRACAASIGMENTPNPPGPRTRVNVARRKNCPTCGVKQAATNKARHLNECQ